EKVDTAALGTERRVDEVTDADVDGEIEKLRQQNAELREPDPPRAAKAGDVLGLHIDLTVDGQPRPDLASEDTRAELGADRLLPELEQGLLGVKVDETR